MEPRLTGSLIADVELLLVFSILLCFFVFLVVRRPLVGFVSFIFLVLTRLHQYIPNSEVFRPSVGVGIIMMLGLFLFLWKTKAPIFFTGPQTFILCAFIAFSWISLFTKGQTLYDAYGHLLIEQLLLVFVSFFATINAVRSMRDLQIVIKTLVGIGLTISLMTLVQSFVTGNFFGLGRSWSYQRVDAAVIRAGSLGIEPNGVAATLAVLLPLFCYFLYDGKRSVFINGLYYVGVLLVVLTIFLTYSRTGFVCLTAACFLIFGKKLSIKNIIVFLSLLLMVVIVIPGAFWERIASTGTTDTTGTGRLLIYQTALRMIQAHPLTGVGYGQFHYFYGHYGGHLDSTSPHNTYLSIAAESGVINLSIFICLILATFVDLRRLRGKALHVSDPGMVQLVDALSASLIVALVAGLTLDCSSWVPFYICLALVVALKRI